MRAALALALASMVATAAPVALAADRDGNFKIRGLGNRTCAQLLEDRAEDPARGVAYAAWMNGYFTAVNQYVKNTYDLTPDLDAELLGRLVVRFCTGYPEETVWAAVGVISRDFAPVRQARKADPITLTNGEHTATVQKETLRRVQIQLKRHGHYTSTVDGVYGPGTRAAIEAYQSSKDGMEVTGVPDPTTVAALLFD